MRKSEEVSGAALARGSRHVRARRRTAGLRVEKALELPAFRDAGAGACLACLVECAVVRYMRAERSGAEQVVVRSVANNAPDTMGNAG